MKKIDDEKIALCREMRLNSTSIKKIAKELKISPATVSTYVSDIELSDDAKKELMKRYNNQHNYSSKLTDNIKERTKELWDNRQTTKVERNNYDSKKVGDITTLQVMSRFTEYGYGLYIPFGDRTKIDLIVEDDNGKIFTIQCKTARLINNGRGFEFRSCSNNWNSKKRTNYIGTCDLFATYLRELNNVYLINVNKCPVTTVIFSLFKELCLSNSRFADDYLFDGSREISDYM